MKETAFIRIIREYGILSILIVNIFVLFFFLPNFFTTQNLTNLTRTIVDVGIAAIGMTLVIITAGIDLSVGSCLFLTGVIAAHLNSEMGMGAAGSVLIAVLLGGVLLGMINGFFVARFEITPFAVTLGTMILARGIALIVSGGRALGPLSEGLLTIGQSYINPKASFWVLCAAFLIGCIASYRKESLRSELEGKRMSPKRITGWVILLLLFLIASIYIFCSHYGIPLPVLIFAFFLIIGGIVLNRTTFGRYLYAIGGNEEAARLSGINIFSVKLLVYTIASFLGSISGIVTISRLNGVDASIATYFELNVIASVVIGGTSLMGGVGTIKGTIIGVLFFGVIQNEMDLFGVTSFWQMVVKGLLILFATWFDTITKARERRTG